MFLFASLAFSVPCACQILQSYYPYLFNLFYTISWCCLLFYIQYFICRLFFFLLFTPLLFSTVLPLKYLTLNSWLLLCLIATAHIDLWMESLWRLSYSTLDIALCCFHFFVILRLLRLGGDYSLNQHLLMQNSIS